MERTQVVVIGAGVAGLACAREVDRLGHSVVVLEGRPRIGGRVLTHRTAGGLAELGAQVVHPTADLALNDLIGAAGMPLAPLERDADLVVVAAGQRWDSPSLIYSHPPPPWAVARALTGPGSVTECLRDLPEIPRALAALWVEQSVGGDCDGLDAGAVAAVERARGGGVEAVLTAGFDTLAAALADRVDVRLGAPASVVQWGAAGVSVSGAVPITAAAVVVTVPPAVIQAAGLRFDPPLPPAKLAALSALASVDAVSVALTAERPAERSTWALFAEEPWGLWHSTAGSPIVVGHVKGPRAAVARKVTWSMSNASWLLHQLDPSLGAAIEVVSHDWGADLFARGAHTMPTRGSEAGAFEWARPLADVVFFAGEASAGRAGRGLVQGALSSGRRAAQEAVRALGHGAPAATTSRE